MEVDSWNAECDVSGMVSVYRVVKLSSLIRVRGEVNGIPSPLCISERCFRRAPSVNSTRHVGLSPFLLHIHSGFDNLTSGKVLSSER